MVRVSPLMALALPLLSAAVVAAVAALAQAGRWQWYHWLIAAPLLYVLWLLVLLGLMGISTRVVGDYYPKPRHLAIPPYGKRSKDEPELLAIWAISLYYRRAAIVEMLPFARFLPFALYAYSPSVHFGRGSMNLGFIYDPDLTFVGDNVAIGASATITAHSITVRPTGESVYVSSPVHVGHRVTIGGNGRVDLGCVIGDDAIIEPGAWLSPFTRVGPGEVWGGNPASFRRSREVTAGGAFSPAPPIRDVDPFPPASSPGAGVSMPDLRALGEDGAGQPAGFIVEHASIRALLLDVLDVDPSEAPPVLSDETCPAWDSLGRLAIAAALFDRYGIELGEADAAALGDEQDVLRVLQANQRLGSPGEPSTGLAGRGLQSRPGEDACPTGVPSMAGAGPFPIMSPPEAPLDVELLPLEDPQAATQLLADRFRNPLVDGQALRVVTAASFRAQPLASALKLWGRAFGFELDCQFAEYDQIVQALLDRDGPFFANRQGVNVVLTRPEDLLPHGSQEGAGRIEEILTAIERFSLDRPAGGQLLVGTLPPVASAFSLLATQDVEAMRQRWRTRLQELPGVELFDFDRLVSWMGIEHARSSRGEALTRGPYSQRLYQEVGRGLARHIRAARRAPCKVLLLDCDNTLWGGVVGEL
ncbi:MAG: hypothetical protein KGJ86_09440, partial [Chloroflexota bacterium]|nr:hypothetical protein [Chloroflexota bacterium]